ncbi:MAG: TIGR04551 family protein [Kofleriaceae bacterium]
MIRIAALLVTLAACPSFHPEPLPGAPRDATFVDVDGVHVRYRESGSGPAVVMIHGYGASLESWGGVQPVVAQHHRVISIDLKGFGWSSRPEGDYSPAGEAALVWHVLDKLGVDDVAIVGHSWGTSVSLAMAVQHPDRVRRVALYDAYVYDDQVPSFFRWAEVGGLGELLFGLFYDERIEDRAPLAYYDERWITQARVDRVEDDLARPGTKAAALAVARAHHFGALHEKLRDFKKPVLLLWGAQDQVTPISFGHRLVNELANAELKTYEHCGHIPMVEAKNVSTRDLTEFLDHDRANGNEVAPPSPDPAPAPEGNGAGSANGGGGGGGSGRVSGGGGPIANAASANTAPTNTAPTNTAPANTAPTESPPANIAPTNTAPTNTANDMTHDAWHRRLIGPRVAQVAADDSDPNTPTTDNHSAPATSDTPKASPNFGPPPLDPADRLPLGADLASLGAELTPRLYAAPREGVEVKIHGYLRVREAGLYNLDLDRGLDTTGKPIFPVPLGGGQMLNSSDMRARTDLAVYAPGVGVAMKARIDWLDNVALGGNPDLAGGAPSTSGGQNPSYVVVKRAWGEALTPVGTLAVGRMGAHFGLGIAANGGDCEDCDHGDSADRAAFVAPLFGHLLAVAYDITSTGPFTTSKDGSRPIGLEPSDATTGPTVAILKIHTPAALARRAAAGLTSVEYAAYVTHRTQDRDVPAAYLNEIAWTGNYTSNDLTARGFSATGTGGWLRISSSRFRLEGELAYLSAIVENPSLIPGAAVTEPVTSSQLGFALESDLNLGPAKIGFDLGYASGDSAPGFGAFPTAGQAATIAGQFDGPQANSPSDRTVDNFRFHPDYHIDQILFREIIGTITDAFYIRPHIKATLATIGTGHLEAGAALIASWAIYGSSTPSGQTPLGIELDPELRYASRDGFALTIDYGVLAPGSAFDGTNLKAQPAQSIRARVGFAF